MEEKRIETEVKPNKLALQASALFAVYFLVLIFILKFLGITAQEQAISTGSKVITQLLSYLPFILAIVYVQTNHKKDLGGYITFGKAFSAGFKVAAYSGLFLFVLQVVYYFIEGNDVGFVDAHKPFCAESFFYAFQSHPSDHCGPFS